jgi:pimeloyl-ACP methyl ester carboxylesterase
MVAVIAAASLAATACAGMRGTAGSTPSSSRVDTVAGLESFYRQHPSWSDCKGGFQCADVRVPLNYAKPDGGELKLKVIRLPAQKRADRIGSLVTNPGGPGGSGVDFVRSAARAFGTAILDRFDVVGFDPRGVGQSDPVRCESPKQLDRYFATDTSPENQAEINQIAAVSKEFADGCQAMSGRLLPYVGTVNAARDIDVLRAALGDRKLTYYGASYGTYLGAFYAEQFAKNIRALVLDGAVDPKLTAEQVNIEQAKGFERALRSFAADCVQRPNCPLGNGSVDQALNQVSDLLARTKHTPLKNSSGDGRTINEAIVSLGIAQPLYVKQLWPSLRLSLTQAIKDGDGTSLLASADQQVERRPDGTYSNLMEANNAVNCIDRPYAHDVAAFQKQADEAKKVAPHFGPFIVWSTLICGYWPIKTTQKPRPLAAAGAPPIVVVGTTRDPATPYEWAKGLASELKSGVLLSLDGDGHTAYLQGNPCITGAVETYLVSGKPPAAGTLCR